MLEYYHHIFTYNIKYDKTNEKTSIKWKKIVDQLFGIHYKKETLNDLKTNIEKIL